MYKILKKITHHICIEIESSYEKHLIYEMIFLKSYVDLIRTKHHGR